jgi:hypothetical protein
MQRLAGVRYWLGSVPLTSVSIILDFQSIFEFALDITERCVCVEEVRDILAMRWETYAAGVDSGWVEVSVVSYCCLFAWWSFLSY